MKRVATICFAWLLFVSLTFSALIFPTHVYASAAPLIQTQISVTDGKNSVELPLFYNASDNLYYVEPARIAVICGFTYDEPNKRFAYKVNPSISIEYVLRIIEEQNFIIDKENLAYACPFVRRSDDALLVSLGHIIPILFSDGTVVDSKLHIFTDKSPLLPLLHALENGGDSYSYLIENEKGIWAGAFRQAMIETIDAIMNINFLDQIDSMTEDLTSYQEYREMFNEMMAPVKSYLDQLSPRENDLFAQDNLAKYAAFSAVSEQIYGIGDMQEHTQSKLSDVSYFDPATDSVIAKDKNHVGDAINLGISVNTYMSRIATALEDHVRMLKAVYPTPKMNNESQAAVQVYKMYEKAYRNGEMADFLQSYENAVFDFLYDQLEGKVFDLIFGAVGATLKQGGMIVKATTAIFYNPDFNTGVRKMSHYRGYRRIASDATAKWSNVGPRSNVNTLERARLAAILTLMTNRQLFEAEKLMATHRANEPEFASIIASQQYRIDNIDQLLFGLYRAKTSVDGATRENRLKRQDLLINELLSLPISTPQTSTTTPAEQGGTDSSLATYLQSTSWVLIEPELGDTTSKSQWPGVEILDFEANGTGRHFTEISQNGGQNTHPPLNDSRASSTVTWYIDGDYLHISVVRLPIEVFDESTGKMKQVTLDPLSFAFRYDRSQNVFVYEDNGQPALIALPAKHELVTSQEPLTSLHQGFYTKMGYVLLEFPLSTYGNYSVVGPYVQGSNNQLSFWNICDIQEHNVVFSVNVLGNGNNIRTRMENVKVITAVDDKVLFLERPSPMPMPSSENNLLPLLDAWRQIWGSVIFVPYAYPMPDDSAYPGDKEWQFGY